ncbi:MAG: hypothetical protein AAF850_03445 [Pseudomonadota bacterium]
MYAENLSNLVSLSGFGPDAGYAAAGGAKALRLRAGPVGVVIRSFGPFATAVVLSLFFVIVLGIDFGSFSNWYIRILFSLSLILHATMLASIAQAPREDVNKPLAFALVIGSFVFTIMQVIAALSLVEFWTGYTGPADTLLQGYRSFIAGLFQAFAASEQAGAAAYRFVYDVAVLVVSGLILGLLGVNRRKAA